MHNHADAAHFLGASTLSTDDLFPLYRINGQWDGKTWRFSDGTDVSYTNWAPGQPDSLGKVIISSLEDKRMAYSNHFQHLPNQLIRAYAYCLWIHRLGHSVTSFFEKNSLEKKAINKLQVRRI